MTARPTVSLLLAATAFLASSAADAQVIGVVSPQNGSFELLGRQIRGGAAFAGISNGVTLKMVPESCEDGSGEAVARRLVELKVDAAIGFLCSESLDGAMPPLQSAGIPAITLSVRWQGIMEDALKRDWPLFRMAPATRAESDKLADVILTRWPGVALALIDDGTISGRDLSEAVRSKLEERGMKPVFTDTFRPGQEQQIGLVRRLQSTGATHVFIGGDRSDVSIIARDASAEKIKLTIVSGDAMRAADAPVALQDGVYAVALPDYGAKADANEIATSMREKGIEPEGYVLPAYAAVQIAAAAAEKAKQDKSTVAAELLSNRFATAIGPIGFTSEHELADNPYILQVWQDGRFVRPPADTQ